MNLVLKLWLYLAFAALGEVGFFLYTNGETISRNKLIDGMIYMVFPCRG